MKRRIAFVLTLFTTMTLLFGIVAVASVYGFKKDGTQGCTPGYWKQSQHFGSWTAPYDPTDAFVSAGFASGAFGSTKTLLEVLQQGGGGLNALGRHTVAALLNAASPAPNGVNFAYNTAEVIAKFNDTWDGTAGEISALKDEFAYENEKGCPLGRDE